MKNLRKVLFFVLFALATVLAFGMKNVMAAEESATISFSDTSNRLSQTTTQQVWAQNGITVTNNKAASTSNIIDSSNPVRFYASSEVVVEHSQNITKVEFDCYSAAYATTLSNSTFTGAIASVNSDKCVFVLSADASSLTITKLSGQVRVDAITVYYTESGVELSAGDIFAKSQTKSSLNLSYTSEVTEASQNVTDTLTFNELGYENAQDLVSEETNNVKFAFSKGSNTNGPKYYTSGTAGRFYGGNTITISASGQITKIVLTLGSSDGKNEITANVGSFSTNTWTGSANEVVFTIGGTSGNRRIAAIAVTVEATSVETITFNDGDAQLRFGAEIEAELFNSLKEEDANVTFGVAVIATESLGGEVLTVETEGAYVADLEIAAVNDNGEAVEAAKATKYQFALVITGIKVANFDTEFTAVSYVCVNGTYYYMVSKAHSAVSIAQAYVNADDTSAYSEHLNALRTLANLE